MKQHNKVGIYATLASICLALIAATILVVIPEIEDVTAQTASIIGAIMATGFAGFAAIVAAARSWEQEDKPKRRFPEPFVEAIRDICARMTPEDAAMVMRGIERIELDATNVWIYCVDPVHQVIEECDPRIIGERLHRAVQYRVRRAN